MSVVMMGICSEGGLIVAVICGNLNPPTRMARRPTGEHRYARARSLTCPEHPFGARPCAVRSQVGRYSI